MDLKQCPKCEAIGRLSVVHGHEGVSIRGVFVYVKHNYYCCEACNGMFDDPDKFGDYFKKAYAAYERKTGNKIIKGESL